MNLQKSFMILFALCAMTSSSFAADLFQSIEKGSSDDVAEALKSTKDINAKDQFGKTALHKAVNLGDFEIIEMILEKGADVNAKDIKGDTPLHTAAWKENEDLMKFLIEKKADPQITNTNGQTAQEIVLMLKAMPSPVSATQNANDTDAVGVTYDFKAKMNDMEKRTAGIEGFNLTTGKYLNKARESFFSFEKDRTVYFTDTKGGELKGTYSVEGRDVYVKFRNTSKKLRVISFTGLKDTQSGILYTLEQ